MLAKMKKKKKIPLHSFFEKGDGPVMRQQKILPLLTKTKLHLKENTKGSTYIKG